jgi:DnaD/phage-associated family protein
MPTYIQEWTAAGLVLMYDSDEGPVLWFRGFAKNQQGMRYDRESPSRFTPPPASSGGVPTNSGLTPEELRTNSGNCRAEVEGQVQEQVEVKVKVKAGDAPAAAAENDVARLWQKWNDNMPGAKSQVIVDEVNALLDDYGIAEIEEAIRIACRRNKRTLSYIQGILAKGALKDRASPSGGDYAPSRNGRISPADKTQAAANELREMLKRQGKEDILHG